MLALQFVRYRLWQTATRYENIHEPIAEKQDYALNGI